VEGANVERLSRTVLGPGAQLADLAIANLVGQGLARPGDVAVDLIETLVASSASQSNPGVQSKGKTARFLLKEKYLTRGSGRSQCANRPRFLTIST